MTPIDNSENAPGSALITGAAGFIGSHMLDRLLSEGTDVTAVDNFSTGQRENLVKNAATGSDLTILECDLRSPPNSLQSAVGSASTIFHFAANPEVKLSTSKPRTHFENNVFATFNLLELWRRFASDARLVFASSSSVYGQPKSLPVTESDDCAPASVYGATKLACEELICTYCRLYGLSAIALRYANILGPRLTHGVVIDFVKKLCRNPTRLEILGDGTQTRSYLYVDDAVEATLSAIQTREKGCVVFNVGNLDSLTVEEVAHIVIQCLNLDDLHINYSQEHGQLGWPGDVHQIVLDIDRLTGLGFRPHRTSRDSVRLTVKHVKRQGL